VTDYLVAVFPYLKTRKLVRFRGLEFRCADDLEGLCESEKRDVEQIAALFFLRNGYRIACPTYAIIRFNDDKDKAAQLLRLSEVHLLITYLYSAPDQVRCDVFLPQEHSAVFTFEKNPVCALLVRPDSNVVVDDSLNLPEPNHRKEIDGWNVTRNLRETFYAAPELHIYPALGRMGLNMSQDLHAHFMDGPVSSRNSGIISLLQSWHGRMRGLDRVKGAISWYNRSVSQIEDPEMEIVSLAIAFESLLGLDRAHRTTERFVESVQTLVGRDARLEAWLRQFYDARSSVVHTGQPEQIMFLATGKTPYRRLVDYGRHIFRACVETVLHGAAMADTIGIAELLTTNKERFDRVYATMAGDGDAEKKLAAIAQDVDDIERNQYVVDNSLTVEVQINSVQKVAEQYLATIPAEQNGVLEALKKVAVIKARGDRLATLDAIKVLDEEFKKVGHVEGQHWPHIHYVVRTLVETVWNRFTFVHWYLLNADEK
jgi:hypothetical protein